MLDHPHAFVFEAERMTNERDIEGIRKVFAVDGRWTLTIDGTVISAHGVDEIHQVWATLCRFMDARRIFVAKSLVTADDRTIVNEWTDRVAGRSRARGIEVWQLNERSKVTDQRLYGFLDPRPDSSTLQILRTLAAHPRTALAFARIRRG